MHKTTVIQFDLNPADYILRQYIRFGLQVETYCYDVRTKQRHANTLCTLIRSKRITDFL